MPCVYVYRATWQQMCSLAVWLELFKAQLVRLAHILASAIMYASTTTAVCTTVRQCSRKDCNCMTHVATHFDMLCTSVQCCFMGQVYRDAVRIHNRGSAAMKATLSLPHAVQPFLQAQPIAGFCQVCLQPIDHLQASI